MRTFAAWIQASRMPSQSYIFFPLLLGAGAAVRLSGKPVDLPALIIAQVFGLLIQLYIVYANDYADRDDDVLNATYTIFSGGSRVIPEGKLSPRELLRGVYLVVAANLVLCLSVALFYDRMVMPLILFVSVWLLWLYSFPPVRLSYRGGGELLQVAGVGLVLPLAGWYLQDGHLAGFPWGWFLFIIPLEIAAALATTLPDEPADRACGKMTAAARVGALPVKSAIMVFNAAGLGLFLGAEVMAFGDAILLCAVPVLLLLLQLAFISGSHPGSRRLTTFVSLAIGVKVVWTGSFALYLLLS